jgi:hypothetical protein
VVEITCFFLYSSDTGHRLDENNTQLRQRCRSVISDALSALPASSLPRTMITRFPLSTADLYPPRPDDPLSHTSIHPTTGKQRPHSIQHVHALSSAASTYRSLVPGWGQEDRWHGLIWLLYGIAVAWSDRQVALRREGAMCSLVVSERGKGMAL